MCIQKLKINFSIILATIIVSVLMFSCEEGCFTCEEEYYDEYDKHYDHNGKKGDHTKGHKGGKKSIDFEKYYTNENFEEFTDTVPDLCEKLEVCLKARNNPELGALTITHDKNYNLYVTYSVEEDWELRSVALALGVEDDDGLDILPLNEYGKIDLTEFPFVKKIEASSNEYTVKINVKNYLGDRYKECIVLVAGAIAENKETCLKYKVWAGDCDDTNEIDVCGFSIRDGKLQRGEAGEFIEYCYDDYECDEPYSEDVDFTYAWEDLRNKGNDADYNDLVIQAVLNKQKDKLILKFLPVARGAGYDHKFKFGILNKGVVKTEGAASTEVKGDSLIVTVFESTKAVLPPENQSPSGYSANVVYRGDNNDCLATSLQESTVTITIDDTYEYDKEKPYDPFITVYTSGSTSDDSKAIYDLHVWQVTGTDIWAKDEKQYPNGILIPADWKWPKENKAIFEIYPDYKDIDNWSDGWHTNLAQPENIIEKNFCE